MTLIIGCIAKEYGILFGDTQLTINNRDSGETRRRETHLKIQRPTLNLAYGILGDWSHYTPDPEDPCKIRIVDFYEIMQKGIGRKHDKLHAIYNYVKDKSIIDGSVLMINKKDNNTFEIVDVSSRSDKCPFSKIEYKGVTFVFNEPFSSINPEFIRRKLLDNLTEYSFKDTLADSIFLINNTLMDCISQGRSISVRDTDGKTTFLDNTIGGFVTATILTREKNQRNNLHNPYRFDFKTLLDKTTTPFSNILENSASILYHDNLSMLIRSAVGYSMDHIRDSLIEVVNRQLKFMVKNNISNPRILNQVIDYVLEQFNLSFEQLEIQEDDSSDHDLIDVWDGFHPSTDMNYIKRFYIP